LLACEFKQAKRDGRYGQKIAFWVLPVVDPKD
jgi:hypothetical protein